MFNLYKVLPYFRSSSFSQKLLSINITSEGKNMFELLSKLSISKKVVGFITILLSIMLGISIYSFYKTRVVNDEIVDEDEWMVPLTDSLGLIESHSLAQEVQVQRIFRLYARKPIDKETLNKE